MNKHVMAIVHIELYSPRLVYIDLPFKRSL